MTEHAVTVRYECDSCCSLSGVYESPKGTSRTSELKNTPGWHVYGDGRGGLVHECPKCHRNRLEKLPKHLGGLA